MKNKTLILSIIGAVVIIGAAYFVTKKDSSQPIANTATQNSTGSMQGMDPNMPGMDMSSTTH